MTKLSPSNVGSFFSQNKQAITTGLTALAAGVAGIALYDYFSTDGVFERRNLNYYEDKNMKIILTKASGELRVRVKGKNDVMKAKEKEIQQIVAKSLGITSKKFKALSRSRAHLKAVKAA